MINLHGHGHMYLSGSCGGRIELVDCRECIRVISMGVRLCVLCCTCEYFAAHQMSVVKNK